MNNNDKLDKGATQDVLKNAIAQAIRDHIKVDATGLAPTVISAFVFGFDQAAEAALTALKDMGMAVVPVEATEEQYEAGVKAWPGHKAAYAAMVKAGQAQPAAPNCQKSEHPDS